MYKASIIILFLFYWLFAFFRGFELCPQPNKLISGFESAQNLLLPPVYKMFIGPYKTKFQIIYSFYKGNNKIEEVAIERFVQTNAREELPFSINTLKIFTGVESACYFIDIQYQNEFKKLKQKKIDNKLIDKALKKYLCTDIELKKNLKTIAAFHKLILQKNKRLKESTKVKVTFNRIPILLDYEKDKGYIDDEITYRIGKKTIYEEFIPIK